MKTLIICVASILLIGCNLSSTRPDSGMNSETKALYDKNLGLLKEMISAYENEQLDKWSTYVADSAVWNPASYGAMPGTKETWAAALAGYVSEWDSIRLMNANFLPGVDQLTKEFDGSVRFYGLWVGKHKSGVETSLRYYATADFNSDGKLVVYSEYFDAGGLLNAIKPKEYPPQNGRCKTRNSKSGYTFTFSVLRFAYGLFPEEMSIFDDITYSEYAPYTSSGSKPSSPHLARAKDRHHSQSTYRRDR